MAPRRCTHPDCRSWTTTGRCDEHGGTTGTTTTARGYGAAHQAQRARWAPIVAAGEVECSRCGHPIEPGTPWDLDHDDGDRTRYRGPSHPACNRSTA